MSRQKIHLIIAVLVPVVLLVGLVIIKHRAYITGREFLLPISGYDPRDILSGHYLIYTVDYGVPDKCGITSVVKPAEGQEAQICLEPYREFMTYKQPSCEVFVTGTCTGNRFVAGIERFYIPETQAKSLEVAIQKHPANIQVFVQPDGSVQVKNLLINGQSWQKFK